MPSYEQIRLIGGPCDGDVHMWDGGDYFEVQERPPVKISTFYPTEGEPVDYIKAKRHTYRRHIDAHGNRTDRFIYLGG